MTILITGATDGIGLATAKQLARQGAELVLHGRNDERVEQARADVLHGTPQAQVQVVCADLADLAQVASMAADLRKRLPRLDALINNAGVYMAGRGLSRQGIEMTLAVNHVAHFLLTQSLLPLLKNSDEARVVTVSSVAHKSGKIGFNDMNRECHYDAYAAYADSKLANALFAFELARRETWLASNCLHPGVIDTKLLHAGFNMQGASPEQGARTSVYLATSPEVRGISGRYFDDGVAVEASAAARDKQTAQRLWAWSEKTVRPFLPH